MAAAVGLVSRAHLNLAKDGLLLWDVLGDKMKMLKSFAENPRSGKTRILEKVFHIQGGKNYEIFL
jgi:hypothetical protein